MLMPGSTPIVAGSTPAEHGARYETQRDIYALAVAESRGVDEVEVTYVFLERPDNPVVTMLGQAEIEAGRDRLVTKVKAIERGDFPPADPPRRDWSLCRGCPALGRTCSGPVPPIPS